MEMISAKALQYKNKNTKALLAIHPEEYPVSLQLFGSDPKIMSEMAKDDRRAAVPDPGHQYGMPGAEGSAERRGICTYEEPESWYMRSYRQCRKAIEKPVTVKIQERIRR